ncbi:sensor histidine kinase [Halorubrum sp. SD626R]|uniref:sensor histidine kinase n=1 Tax=Halorubrum TaxID=56688 RepID=UPI0010F7A093|nr:MULTISPECIES: GAF domain-containing sensor histidine kinase [Halorubrum]TKX78181.1 sensor histidine kinase [Halorubrum sp. SD626R]
MSDAQPSEGDVLRRMYRITADQERSFEGKVPDLLDLGREYLGVEVGFLTEIDGDTQLIIEARGDHDLLRPDSSCPLSRAYCRKTIDIDGALTVQHARVEGWEDDAAYEEFGLEAYIGAKVLVDGEVYGTFCFADTEPRDRPFSEDEETFVELLAQWVGYEIFHAQATERIQSQRDQLEEFTRIVSHDIRNPLGVVEGYLELAEETGDPEHFERCREAIHRMESLVDDLLFLTREGQTIGGRESIALGDLVRECWSFVDADGATLRVETDRDLYGDWSRLQQVFENLFRNAVEHGGDEVTVTVGELDDGAGIYVADDGDGIPESDREEVFSDGYTTAESGTGLGLAIIRQVVAAHGWTIGVTESDEGGARFEIRGMDPDGE